jgi:chromosome segregation ATPase
MRLFGSKNKKKDFIDLSERYERKQEELSQIKKNETPQDTGFNFLGDLAKSIKDKEESSSDYVNILDANEKKRRLSKRLLDMTNKTEELSNQIYHLQQRIEVLEQKMNINRF